MKVTLTEFLEDTFEKNEDLEIEFSSFSEITAHMDKLKSYIRAQKIHITVSAADTHVGSINEELKAEYNGYQIEKETGAPPEFSIHLLRKLDDITIISLISKVVMENNHEELTINIISESPIDFVNTAELINQLKTTTRPVEIKLGENINKKQSHQAWLDGFYYFQDRRFKDPSSVLSAKTSAKKSTPPSAVILGETRPVATERRYVVHKQDQASAPAVENKQPVKLVYEVFRPIVFSPPLTIGLADDVGPLQQLYPFDEKCDQASFNQFIKEKQASFIQLYGENNLSADQKKEALENLIGVRLPLEISIDNDQIDKMKTYLLEKGIPVFKSLIENLKTMPEERLRDFATHFLKKSTNWSYLLSQANTDHPDTDEALSLLRAMPADEYEWWVALSKTSDNVNSNLSDLLNTHRYFMSVLKGWGLELPKFNLKNASNLKDTYKDILYHLQSNPTQDSLNALAHLNMSEPWTIPVIESNSPKVEQPQPEVLPPAQSQPQPLTEEVPITLDRKKMDARITETGVSTFISNITNLLAETSLNASEQQQIESDYRYILTLNQYYRFRDKPYALRDLDNEELKQQFTAIAKQYRSNPDNGKTQQEMLALACEALFRSTGNFPYPAQIISVLVAMRHPGTNSLMNMSSEQDKTTVNLLLSVMNMAFHHQSEYSPVVITNDSMTLAARDFKQSKKFYKLLGIESLLVARSEENDVLQLASISYATSAKGKEKENLPSIIFSTVEDIGLHLLAQKDKFEIGSLEPATNTLHAVMQAKNGDTVLLERAENLSLAVDDQIEHPLAFVYKAAASFSLSDDYKRLIGVPLESESTTIDQEYIRSQFRERLSRLYSPRYQENQAKITDQFIDFVLDATFLASKMVENEDYKVVQETIDNKTITTVHLIKNKKEDTNGTLVFEDGVQQALFARLAINPKNGNLIVPNQPKTTQTTTIPVLINQVFSRTQLTSDSADTAQLDQAKDYYNVHTALAIPSHRSGSLHFLPAEFAPSKRKSFFGDKSFPEAIQRHVRTHQKQPNVVYCRSLDKAKELHQQLEKELGNKVQVLDVESQTPEEFEKSITRAQQAGIVTLTTLASRDYLINSRNQSRNLSVIITFPPESEHERKLLENQFAEGTGKYIYNIDTLLREHKLDLKGKSASEKEQVLKKYTQIKDKDAQIESMKQFYVAQVQQLAPDSMNAFLKIFDEEKNRKRQVQANKDREILLFNEINLAIWGRTVDLVNPTNDGDIKIQLYYPGNLEMEVPANRTIKNQHEPQDNVDLNISLTDHYITNNTQSLPQYQTALQNNEVIFSELNKQFTLPESFHQNVIHEIGLAQTPNAVAAHLRVLQDWILPNENQLPLDTINKLRPLITRYATLLYKQEPVEADAQQDVLKSLENMVDAIAKMPVDKEQQFWNNHLAEVVKRIMDSESDLSVKKDQIFDALKLWRSYSEEPEIKMLAQSLMDLTQGIRFAPSHSAAPRVSMNEIQLKAFIEVTSKRINSEHGDDKFIDNKLTGLNEINELKIEADANFWQAATSTPVTTQCSGNLNLKSLLAISTRTGEKSTFSTVSSQQFAKLEANLPKLEQQPNVSDDLKDQAKLAISTMMSDLDNRSKKSKDALRFWLDSSKYDQKTKAFDTLCKAATENITNATTPHELQAAIRLFVLEVTNNKELTQRAGKFFANTGSVTLIDDVKAFAKSMEERIENPPTEGAGVHPL